MGRAPCCDKAKVKKGPWSPEEDTKLKDYIHKNGTGGNWIALPQKAGLRRCGKSCRLRWLNYLRPNIKHGEFSDDEDRLIYTLFASIGSRWSLMATQLPGRTDNDIKNYWNTKLKKKLMNLITTCPQTGKPLSSSNWSYPSSSSAIPASDYHPIQPSHDHGYINVDPLETYQVKDSSTLLMFEGGGDQDQAAGCSSNSDGRCHDHEYGGGVFDDHDNMGGLKTSNSYKGLDENGENASGYFGDSTLEPSLEEFKKLISTNLCSSNINNNLNVFYDEIRSVSAEDLFHGGLIKSMEPPPTLQLPEKMKRIKTSMGERERGRERGSSSSSSSSGLSSQRSRRTRSLPPVVRASDQVPVRPPTSSTCTTLSTSGSGKGSKIWSFVDLLLFRSASDGRAMDRDPLKKYSAIFRKHDEDLRNSSLRSDGSGSGSGSKRRGRISAHELHYTVNRAVSNDMKKKTFLPYKQGILGRLAFNPTVHALANGFGFSNKNEYQ